MPTKKVAPKKVLKVVTQSVAPAVKKTAVPAKQVAKKTAVPKKAAVPKKSSVPVKSVAKVAVKKAVSPVKVAPLKKVIPTPKKVVKVPAKKVVVLAKPLAKKSAPTKKVAAPLKVVAKPVVAKKVVLPAKPAPKKVVAPVAVKPLKVEKLAKVKEIVEAKPNKAVKPPKAEKLPKAEKAPKAEKIPKVKVIKEKVIKETKAQKRLREASIKKVLRKVAPKSGTRAESAAKAAAISAKQTTPIPTKVLVGIPQKPVRRSPDEPLKEVKLPKIGTKTSVPYSPGYVAMEKRVDIPKTNNPLVKYSDADLTDFKELINKKLESAKKELAFYQGSLSRKDSLGGDNDDARYMTMEDGSMSMEREQMSQSANRTVTYIDHLEKALMRIENKTYGVCRVTGKLIDKARLRAVPHATLSLEAKLGLVKTNHE